MIFPIPRSRHSRLLLPTLLSTLLVLGLVACAGQETLPVQEPAPSANPQAEINRLLAEAKTSTSPQKASLLLEAAELLQTQGRNKRASTLLQGIDASSLNSRQYIQYTLLFSDIALLDDAYFLAERILTNPRLDRQWQSLDREQQITLRQRRADVFMLLGETETSINERLQLQALLEPESPQALSNQDNLWQSLMTLSPTRLEQLARESKSPELQGWFSLALISKNNQSNMEKQLAQVNKWRNQWPQHPASVRLPKDLQLLQRLLAERPQRVALLLPQQGRLEKAGNAVRDGFLAAYYQSRLQHSKVPLIKTYDSSQGDILATYQQAVDEGAELVIGPLDKANVELLSKLDTLPVPTLAVNYTDNGSEPPPGLYQFGLAVEDEARQTAQRAWIEGHRSAMILAADSDWSGRGADTFRDSWQALGGTVVADHRFRERENFSELISRALHINQSEERAKAMRGLLNRNLEFEPRRRQDIDMLFLVARSQEARQINPTLAFHYASQLPVFATSYIFDGDEDGKGDRDLNGIKFSTLPWYFDKSSPEKRAIQATVNPAPSYQRLYALGIDSFHLYPRLQQLEQSPLARFYGSTGSLSLSPQRRIERDQVWAEIVNGSARPLPMLVSHD
ncbi:MAG: ABC transporter substrate-binding protein [Gammaproteobacteria bacterium]|nr:ABC transporter substrate-binding protein [Gammaproteobacteria bacterium]